MPLLYVPPQVRHIFEVPFWANLAVEAQESLVEAVRRVNTTEMFLDWASHAFSAELASQALQATGAPLNGFMVSVDVGHQLTVLCVGPFFAAKPALHEHSDVLLSLVNAVLPLQMTSNLASARGNVLKRLK